MHSPLCITPCHDSVSVVAHAVVLPLGGIAVICETVSRDGPCGNFRLTKSTFKLSLSRARLSHTQPRVFQNWVYIHVVTRQTHASSGTLRSLCARDTHRCTVALQSPLNQSPISLAPATSTINRCIRSTNLSNRKRWGLRATHPRTKCRRNSRLPCSQCACCQKQLSPVSRRGRTSNADRRGLPRGIALCGCLQAWERSKRRHDTQASGDYKADRHMLSHLIRPTLPAGNCRTSPSESQEFPQQTAAHEL